MELCICTLRTMIPKRIERMITMEKFSMKERPKSDGFCLEPDFCNRWEGRRSRDGNLFINRFFLFICLS